MTLNQKTALAVFITSVLFAAAILFSSYANLAGASAPSGLPATIATSSNPIITATAATIIATSTCSARIISTASSTIMLTFTDKDTPSQSFGTFQAASTTKEYDSGQYGCGRVKAMSFNGVLGVITVIDSN